MLKERAVYIVEVNLDPVPGWNFSPESVTQMLQKELEERIPWYLPTVRFERKYEVETFNMGDGVVQEDGDIVTRTTERTEEHGDVSHILIERFFNDI